MTILYAAGKIGKNDWRGIRMGSGEEGMGGMFADRDFLIPLGSDLFYGGPFFRGCDHGCTHGPRTHAATYECSTGDPRGFLDFHEAQDQLLSNSQFQIQRCDIFFARLTSSDAFGTFSEIGYASALGKPILLSVSEINPKILQEMWFLVRMSLASPLCNRMLDAIPTDYWPKKPSSVRAYRSELLELLGDPFEEWMQAWGEGQQEWTPEFDDRPGDTMVILPGTSLFSCGGCSRVRETVRKPRLPEGWVFLLVWMKRLIRL